MEKFVDGKEIIQRLKLISSPTRYQHSLGVMETAVQLANHYGVDREKASLAGLVHDWAKSLCGHQLLKMATAFDLPVDCIVAQCPDLLHGPVGAELIERDIGINDLEIKKAVAQHTMGAETMSPLAKIIFVADYIEPTRNFPGVEGLRDVAYQHLDLAVLLCTEQTIGHLLRERKLIHPQTISTRNTFLLLVERTSNGR